MTNGHRNIAEILCRRDGCSMIEAKSRIDYAIQLMEEANYDTMECEDIMADELGLEPDYVFDLLL